MTRQFEHDEVFEKPFNPKQLKRLLRYLLPYKAAVSSSVSLMLFVSGAALAGPLIIRKAIDGPITSGVMQELHLLGIAYLLLKIGSYVATYYRTRLMSYTGQGVICDMRKELFEHIQKLSLKFYDKQPAGKIMVCISNDVESLNKLLTTGIVQVANDMITLVSIIVIMLLMHWQLALYTFAILPVLFALGLKLRRHVRQRWRQVRAKRANMNANLQESISGVRVIQAYNQEPMATNAFGRMNQDFTNSWMKAIKINTIFGPSVELTGAVGTCIVYFAGAMMVVNGSITAGTLVAFISYVGQFWEPISRMSNFYNQLLVAMASSERVFAILDTKPHIKDMPKAKELPRVKGHVAFENVSFGYKEGALVLQDINFEIAAGETIALVGPTGAGKSSLINLLPRFYDVNKGKVFIDGFDIKEVKKDTLRQQIGLVLQDTFIFSGTILENIGYGRLDASRGDIIAAAKAVNAHSFIMTLEKGYDTQINERGSRLSVGQRQLISFARALLADPRILILDEATSSIDTHTEQLVQKALLPLLKNRTAFVIAHRLSTIRNAHKILVIDDGRIVEGGTHKALMKKKGAYYDLHKAQFKYLEHSAGSGV